MFPASTHKGQSIAAFPDVCKVPILGVPVPIPYANVGMTTRGGVKTKTMTKSSFSKTSGDEAGVLKGQLSALHQKLMTMPAGNTTQWHAALDDYVVKVAKLYTSLASNRP